MYYIVFTVCHKLFKLKKEINYYKQFELQISKTIMPHKCKEFTL